MDPVGISDIAKRADVKEITVRQWRSRSAASKTVFPAPKWVVSGRPVWEWADVQRWLKKTGRIA